MKARLRPAGFWAAAVIIAACHIGCGKKQESGEPPSALAEPDPVPSSPETRQEMASVNQSLQDGSFDEAVAKLVKMKESGRPFSRQDAAEYRKALGEAYSKALEAQQKGDPRAAAALELIKAAQNR